MIIIGEFPVIRIVLLSPQTENRISSHLGDIVIVTVSLMAAITPQSLADAFGESLVEGFVTACATTVCSALLYAYHRA